MSNELCAWEYSALHKPKDVIHFLNSLDATLKRIKDVKICAAAKDDGVEFSVFFRRGKPKKDPESWRWIKSSDPGHILDLLNGTGEYKHPVKKARICVVQEGNAFEIYAFYQRGTKSTRPGEWGWRKLAGTPGDVLRFLNGGAPGSRPVKRAEISAVYNQKGRTEFHIFYRWGPPGTPRDNWSCRSYEGFQPATAALNGPAGLPSPVKDIKAVACLSLGAKTMFFTFSPRGFLIITRELFQHSFEKYILWKYSRGFEVFLVTAEWIWEKAEAYQNETGAANKIRCCIQGYCRHTNIKYVLLAGDSEGIPDQISQPWSLPIGYYSREGGGASQVTTLFYADASAVETYGAGENHFLGAYNAYVGVLPIRDKKELRNLLKKTVQYPQAHNIQFTYTRELYPGLFPKRADYLRSLCGGDITLELSVLDPTARPEDAYRSLFEKRGVIVEESHGLTGAFKVGGVIITQEDAARFMFVNPLVITESSMVHAYQMGECLDEALLDARKGPVSIINCIPRSAPGQDGILSLQEAGFWKDLLTGKTIGQALYDNCRGADLKPVCLFGDPSIIVFDSRQE